MPKVSILIPVYNVEKYLSDCLDSVINQTMQDIEIICVNDGSTDHSLEILEKYASKDPRIKVISQENKGTLIARKVACLNATGEYCLFLDSDDWLELNACKELYAISKKYDVEILQYGTKVESISLNQNITRKKIEEITNKLEKRCYNIFITGQHISGITAISYIIQYGGCLGMMGKFVKTTLLKKALLFIEDVYMLRYEDQYLYLTIFYLAQSYYGIRDSYYHYRFGIGIVERFGENITWDKFVKNQKSFYVAYHCINRLFSPLSATNYDESYSLSLAIQKILLHIQNDSIMWKNNMFPNSKAFDFVVDLWGIVPVLSQLAKIYNTLEKQAKLAQSLQDSQLLANKPIKNIHTIATYIPTLRNDNGGTPKDVAQSMNYWLQLGYKVICFANGEPTENDYPYSQEVIRITLPKNLLERLETLQESIKKYNIDILIYSNNWDSNLFWDLCLYKSCNVHFIPFNATMFTEPRNKIIAPFAIYCDAILSLNRSDQLFYSAYTKSMFYPKPLLISMPEYNTLPHNTKPVILWLGRLDEGQKRYTHAILIMEKIVQQIPEAQLLIVGSGNGSAELELQSMIQKKNLENNVTLCGDSNHVEDYYSKASIFLMTSAYEGFGNTLIEAYSWGLPVVLYDLPYSEAIRKFQGHICVPQEDIQGATNAIVSLLQNPEELIALGNAGRASLEEYLKTDFKEQWKQVFLSLENEEDRIEPPEDTKILINTFSECYFRVLQDKNKLQKQLQTLQPFRSQIPAYATLATALVGFHAHFPFIFRIFSFMIRRSYSVFASLKNYGLKTTIAKIYKFFVKKIKR